MPPVQLSATDTVACCLRSSLAHHHFQRIAVARIDAVAQQQFDGAGHFRQQGVGLGLGGAAGAQVDLHIAVAAARMVVTGLSYFL